MFKETLFQAVETPIRQIWSHAKPLVDTPRLRILKLSAEQVEAKIFHNLLTTRPHNPEELDPAVISHLAFDVLDLFIRHREGNKKYLIKKTQLEWFSELAFTDELRLKMVWPEGESESRELEFNAFFYTRGEQLVGQGQWTLSWKE